MAITDWPECERPREKLLNRGPGVLSDSELLAIFLRTGVKGKTAVDVARETLGYFEGLRQLLDSDLDSFVALKGLGPARFVLLQAALEVGRRYLQEGLEKRNAFTSSAVTRSFLVSRLRGKQHEVFACLFLDSQNCLLTFEELFQGTIDSASVYPREVVKRALKINASAVIFAHNHPSGVAEPSQADKNITASLAEALRVVGIRVLDHMIVGEGEVASFAERGLI